MKRIAVIMGKMHSGGKKNLVMEYYRHIDRNRFQFDFICDDDSNAIPDEEIAELGGRVYRVAPYQKIWKHMADLNRIFKENKYEIMHAYDNLMNLFPLLIAKKHGVKVRISESISTGNKGEAQIVVKYALKPFAEVATNYLMANSTESAVFQFGQKTWDSGKVAMFKTVIDAEGNAFNAEVRKAKREQMGWKDDEMILGFIGRFVAQKNPIFLMEIMGEIHKMEPKAKLVVVGHGPMEDKIKAKAEELGLGDSFCFVGKTEDIKPLYNAFDAFLLPSLYEGMPVVGVEAQCTGLPTIMADTITTETTACSLAHYLPLGIGAKGWAEKVLEIVKENMPMRRSYAKEVIAAGFDSAYEAKRLEEYYDRALENEN